MVGKPFMYNVGANVYYVSASTFRIDSPPFFAVPLEMIAIHRWRLWF
jgi:hypothetical protein